LQDQLEAAHYPVRNIEVEERGDEQVELVATLVSTAIEPDEIDAVIKALEASGTVSRAAWTASATD
jgi:putative Mg2+ transporter-C (MgtC) family protein